MDNKGNSTLKFRYKNLNIDGEQLEKEMKSKGYTIQYGAIGDINYLDVFLFDELKDKDIAKKEIDIILKSHDNLKREKLYKIGILRDTCNLEITNGFDSDCFDGKTIRHYSLTNSDQINILGAMIKISLGLTTAYKWDNYIGTCFEWTAVQMTSLYMDIDNHITLKKDKYAVLKEFVLSSESLKEIRNIKW